MLASDNWVTLCGVLLANTARTIEDLAGSEEIRSAHLAEALQYRPRIMMDERRGYGRDRICGSRCQDSDSTRVAALFTANRYRAMYNGPGKHPQFDRLSMNAGMRIIIADDEFLVRSSMKSMLGELNLAIDSIDEATNGEEMVSMVGQTPPDIAFVDIRMPGLNGLEAIRAARSLSPQTQWFILTGFPEFDYAQEAIRLGVSGYLLKPASPEELRKVVDDCILEGKKRKTAQNKQFERELMALLYGLTSLEFEGPESMIARANFIGSIFHFDSYLSEKERAERQLDFCRTVQKAISENLDNYNRLALIVLPNGELATVGAWEPMQNFQAEQCIQKYFKALESEARNSSAGDLAVTLTMTKECSTYQELLDQLELLHELGSLRAVGGIGRRLHIDSLSQWAERPGWLEAANHIQSLCRSYRDKNHLNYMKALERLKNSFQGDDFNNDGRLKKSLMDFLNQSIGTRLSADQGPRGWVEILECQDELLSAETPKDDVQHTDLIDQVIAFIDGNYMYNIGIGQIAEQSKITPNYLTTLFHRKTGTNFMAYLKKIRMQKAKELLADPNAQVHQVAEQVGYFSTRHFARLFSEHYGCLPSEYRDRFKAH